MPHPLRILSIEDDPKDAKLIQDLLEAEGIVCEVARVDTQAALVASLEQGGIDLILADYTLPSFDGISALKFAMKACPDVPFIFVSGTLGEEVAIEALKIGAIDYVLKTRLSRLVPSVLRALREATQRAERKRAEEALRRSETYLAEAQGLSKTGSFGWRPSTGEIIWSEETFRIFEYDRTTTPTVELVLQRVHPEDGAIVKQTIERASQAGTNFEHEYRLLMPDGSVKYVHVVARALNDESGSVEFVGAVMDVTAAQARRRDASGERGILSRSAETQPHGQLGIDPCYGRIRYWSEECYRVLGFDPHGGQPRFETFFQRIHPDDQRRLEQAKRARGDKTGFEFDYRIVHPGGEIREIHTVGHPVFSPSGDLVEYVGTVIDITERKRAEALRDGESRYFGDDRARCSAGGDTGEAGARCGRPICRRAWLCPAPRRGRAACATWRRPQSSKGLHQGHRRPFDRTEGGIMRHRHVPQRAYCRHRHSPGSALGGVPRRGRALWATGLLVHSHTCALGQGAGLVCHVLPRTAQSESG